MAFNDPSGYTSWYTFHPLIRESERSLISNLGPRDCLDVGSGPSVFHEVFQGKTISLDASLPMINAAAKEEDRVAGDALRLPFRDSSIPCVFSCAVLPFLKSGDDFFKEVKRILRPGGEFILCDIVKDSAWGSRYARLGAEGDPYYSRAHLYSRKELLGLIRRYFEVKKVASTLRAPPDEEKFEEAEENENGAFLCVKAVPLERRARRA